MDTRIIGIADRPDLAPLLAGWLWEAFWRHDGHTLAEVEAVLAAGTIMRGPPQTFILLLDGVPSGTASLAAQDLDSRPDLTPWLAGVYVVPEARGQGLAQMLVGAVEDAARASGTRTLWLYTRRAERVYLRGGWQTVEYFQRHDAPHALMRRELHGSDEAGSQAAHS